MATESYRLVLSVEVIKGDGKPSGPNGRRVVMGCWNDRAAAESEVSYRTKKLAIEAMRDLEASRG